MEGIGLKEPPQYLGPPVQVHAGGDVKGAPPVFLGPPIQVHAGDVEKGAPPVFLGPPVQVHERQHGHEQLGGLKVPDQAGGGKGPGDVEESPPLRGAAKTAVVEVTAGTGLVALGASAVAKGLAKTAELTAKVAVTGLVGSSVKQIIGFNVPFLFGPVNEKIEELSAGILGNENLPTADRPFIDLQGPARSLITILSFVPGVSEAASKTLRDVTARDLMPKRDAFIEATEFRAAEKGANFELQIKNMEAARARAIEYIQAGAKREELVNLIHGIDVRIVQLRYENAATSKEREGVRDPVRSVLDRIAEFQAAEGKAEGGYVTVLADVKDSRDELKTAENAAASLALLAAARDTITRIVQVMPLQHSDP